VLKMEMLCFSKMLASCDEPTQCHNPDDGGGDHRHHPLSPEDGDSMFLQNVGFY
jgi:hypothetical protein